MRHAEAGAVKLGVGLRGASRHNWERLGEVKMVVGGRRN